MKKSTKDKLLVTIGSATVLSLFIFNIAIDAILENKSEKKQSEKFNKVNYWNNVCADGKGKFIETQNEEGLDKKTSKSLTDKNGCEIRYNKKCISTKCPEIGK